MSVYLHVNIISGTLTCKGALWLLFFCGGGEEEGGSGGRGMMLIWDLRRKQISVEKV